MDRHRGDRSRAPSRWSDGPPTPGDGTFRHPRGGDGFFGPRHHPYRHDHHPGGGGGGRSPGFRPGPGAFGDEPMMPRRGGGFPGPARASSPGGNDGGKFAKLFIGSVPRTATEEEIRPLFEEHGCVMEVALIKDRRTGQQQGCCFIKYATSEEADRAIRALHNQYTLPGGVGPIQVRYADGEKQRLGTVEYKLFVGGLNKRATEQEIEEIFAPYGRVEDVYIMRDDLKQSRGCGFVKFSNRDMAAAAINALNGVFTMRGCDQPLIVRFADPKRPRPGESRGGPAFGGPGFGSRLQAPTGPRPSSFSDEPMGGQPKNVWSSMSPESSAPSALGFGGHLPPQAFPVTSSTGFSPAYIQPMGQQIPSLQKPLASPQRLPESLQAHPTQQNSLSYSQPQGSQTQAQLSQLQSLSSSSFAAFPQALPPQQLIGMGGQLSSSQPLLHVGTPTNLQIPRNQQQAVTASLNQQILPGSATNQLFQQPLQQPVQGLQQLQQQQQQALLLQASLQSPQPVLSQHQQLQLMQPSNPTQQQGSQQNLPTAPQQSISSAQATLPTALPTAIIPSTTPSLQQNSQAGASLTCNWTEHTSPDGFKYYYNSVTKESKWEKPEDLMLFEQQQKMLLQQQQKLVAVQQLPTQAQLQTPSVQSTQQFPQVQQSQALMQFRQQVQLQQIQPLQVPRMQ